MADPPISEVDRHGRQRPYRLEFHMSSVCDQKCVFCSESARMARYEKHPISYASIVRTLIRKRREGFWHVTFTGGEPTVHPRFIQILLAAKRLGYKTYATSDATMLARPAYAAKAVPLLDEICVSIHGDSPEVHDPLAGSPGSFRRVERALRLIAARRPRPYVLTNTVVTKDNLPRVERTVRWLAGLGVVRHCTISNLAPDGAALERFAELAAPLSSLGELGLALARISRETGVVVRFFGVPLCVLGEDWSLPNDLHWTPRVTVERGMVDGRVGLQEIFSPNPGRMRFYAPRCEECSWKGRCFGVFKTYYDHFGDGELRPRRAAAPQEA